MRLERSPVPYGRNTFHVGALAGLLIVGCSSLTDASLNLNTADAISRVVTAVEHAPDPDDDIDLAPPYWPAPDPFEGFAGDGGWDDPAESDRIAPPIVEPTPEPAPASWTTGPPEINGNDIITRAQAMLDIPYVWGGHAALRRGATPRATRSRASTARHT
jgi:hypothetical protein